MSSHAPTPSRREIDPTTVGERRTSLEETTDSSEANRSAIGGRNRSSKRRGMLKSFLRIGLLAYGSILALLIAMESRLVFPAPSSDWHTPDVRDFGAAELFVPSTGDARVHCWVFRHVTPRATIVYLHGNAESVPLIGDRLRFLAERWRVNVVALDFRGYGKTGGRPSEKNMADDCLAVTKWVATNSPFRDPPLVVMGRSLGGFGACYVASEVPIAGLILDRTFSSIVEVAGRKLPMFPVSWIMFNQMKSMKYLKKYQGPLLQIHGHNDQVVPFDLGKKLFDNAPSKEKKFVELKKLNHLVDLPEEFWEAGDKFLEDLSK